MAARKEIILSAQRNGTYHVFHKVIIYFQLAVCCINAEFYPPAQRILNGFSNEALGKNLMKVFFQPYVQ